MWCDSRDNLATLARWLGEQALTNGWDHNDWAYYLEKPWKWTTEWDDLQAELHEDQVAA